MPRDGRCGEHRPLTIMAVERAVTLACVRRVVEATFLRVVLANPAGVCSLREVLPVRVGPHFEITSAARRLPRRPVNGMEHPSRLVTSSGPDRGSVVPLAAELIVGYITIVHLDAGCRPPMLLRLH